MSARNAKEHARYSRRRPPAIELYNWYSRYAHGEAAVMPTGLVLSLVVVLILLLTGWKGREMVYRHRVGVADDEVRRS